MIAAEVKNGQEVTDSFRPAISTAPLLPEYFYRLSCSCRRKFSCSNMRTGWRCERTWLACQCSRHPSAMKQRSPRLRRQVLMRFEPKLSPQPSFTPPRPTSFPELRITFIASSPGAGRTSGAGQDGLRSSMCSKFLSICRRRRELIFSAADGHPDHLRASQSRSQRRPVFVFEQVNPHRRKNHNR